MPTAPKRLLMITERFPPDLGGLARSGARIAGTFERLGVEVDVLAWTKTCPAGSLETVDAGEVHESAKGATLHRLGLYANQDFSMQHTLNVLDWLHSERTFDAVWGHYLFPAGFMAVFFAQRAGLPATVSARGNDVDRMTFPPGDFARLLWTLERAQLVTCVSKDLAKKVGVLLGSSDRIEVAPNAVDTDLFSPGDPPAGLRERLGIEEGEAVLTFAGELRKKKGVDFLMEALREVRRTRPACLLVVGEVRPRDQSRIASFAADHPEDARRIVVTGRLDDPADVAAHLRLSDVFLHPSLWDGLPNAVLEAMACERVVLASDAGGIPDCVEHGATGFLVRRHELHRLGEAIGEILDLNAEERAAVGAAARERVIERFRPEVEEQRLGELLNRLTG